MKYFDVFSHKTIFVGASIEWVLVETSFDDMSCGLSFWFHRNAALIDGWVCSSYF